MTTAADQFDARHTAAKTLQNYRDNPGCFDGCHAMVQNARRAYYDPRDNFVTFGDVSRLELGQQCQYGSRYIFGSVPGYPLLGESLRFRNLEIGRTNYHAIEIHIEDIAEFVRRFREHGRRALGE